MKDWRELEKYSATLEQEAEKSLKGEEKEMVQNDIGIIRMLAKRNKYLEEELEDNCEQMRYTTEKVGKAFAE